MTYTPVTTVSDLRTLDSEEMMDGYTAGLCGASEPDDTHTRAYWHGWRCGYFAAGLRVQDEADRALRRSMVAAGRPVVLRLVGAA